MEEIAVTAVNSTGLVLGLPWYIWVFVVLGMALFLSNVLWFWYWWTMGPVGDYWKSVRKGNPLGILLTKGGKLKFIAMEYIAGAMTNAGLKMTWIIRSPDAWQLGSVPSKLFLDMWGIGADPKMQVAVKTAIDNYNENLSDDDKLKDYYDLVQAIIDKKIDDPILIPAVCEVPLYELSRYLPEVGSADLEGHISKRVSDRMEAMDSKSLPMFMKIFIAMQVGILILLAIVYLLGNGGS
ncbi:MAG: hypothetical protein M0R03_19795 [Novosphingobium sp.]|nr:hypothetical protein [Novosphingobium sp.]